MRFVATQETSRTIGGLNLRCGVIALWCVVAVGCAEVTNAPAISAVTETEPPVAATPPVEDAAVTPEPESVAPVAALADSTADSVEELPVAAEPEPALPSALPEELAAEESEIAVVEPAAPAEPVLAPEPSLAPSVVASATSVDTLDFSSLVTRLRKTKAINLRTKVAVKNESDDLLEQARAYHARTGETTLADLRRSYDSLFQELHSLLEDGDPPLARDIDRSRAAIWEILADPRKFNVAI
jgi:hypothetical protein